jgi:hypothetical protein
VAAHFLLVGDVAGSSGAHFNQRFFHFQDDHADHLGGVFCLVEKVGDVCGDDVAGA